MRVTIVRKNQNTKPPPSEPSMSRGRSVSKKRSIQGKSNHGTILRQPCRYYLKGILARDRLVNIIILPSVNLQNRNGVVRLETSVCSRIIKLMSNQQKAKKNYYSHKKRKRRQECCGYCENCTTIGLRLARLGSIGFSKRKTAR